MAGSQKRLIMGSDMYWSWTKRCWGTMWPEAGKGMGTISHGKGNLDHISHNMKPLLNKLIIKDTLGGEGQFKQREEVFINHHLLLSVFTCSVPCSTTLRVLLGTSANGSSSIVRMKMLEMGIAGYKLQLLL